MKGTISGQKIPDMAIVCSSFLGDKTCWFKDCAITSVKTYEEAFQQKANAHHKKSVHRTVTLMNTYQTRALVRR